MPGTHVYNENANKAERLYFECKTKKAERLYFIQSNLHKTIQRIVVIMRFPMKITDAASLGSAIRARRKELHYTQSDLAEFTGFSTSFISDLERGKETAEIGKAIFLINLLGMDFCLENRE